jgi:crotonobetainyl-CoA:carnitine CoA-transferase CaiB-like acyl-CoA transferase
VRRLVERADVFLTNLIPQRCARYGLGRARRPTPFRIQGADIRPRGAAPGAGAHTFEVLAELAVDDAPALTRSRLDLTLFDRPALLLSL